MILEQHYLDCLSQASYLIGDEETGNAAVVDPRRDVDVYLARARECGLTIRYVLLTHFHADFLAGHLELHQRTGAEIVMGSKAEAGFPLHAMDHGSSLELGQATVRCLETPGHTPESVCYTVHEAPDAPPKAVLTGDTLFIGGVGRPDLLVSKNIRAEDLAGMLHDSIHNHLLTLPDATLVYPGHGAGSACGKGLSTETVSTIGDQRTLNFALSLSRDEFITDVTQGQPETPYYFAYDAARNQELRPTLDEALANALKPLPLEETLSRINRGAVVVDVRPADDYARGHLEGSLSIGLGGRYASWAGTLLHPDQDLILMADPGAEQEAAVRLGRIGYDRILGYVDGGPKAVPADLTRSFPRRRPAELESLAAQGLVLDVRTASEWEQGHVPDSAHIPLTELESRLKEIPRDGEVIALCRSGYRSMIAASILEKHGFRASDVEGGWLALMEANTA